MHLTEVNEKPVTLSLCFMVYSQADQSKIVNINTEMHARLHSELW